MNAKALVIAKVKGTFERSLFQKRRELVFFSILAIAISYLHMNPVDDMSALYEELRKAEKRYYLLYTKARILAEMKKDQREELQPAIAFLFAIESHGSAFQTDAEAIEVCEKEIKRGNELVEIAETKAQDARECMEKARHKVNEGLKKEEKRRLIQQAWNELALLEARVGDKTEPTSSATTNTDQATGELPELDILK